MSGCSLNVGFGRWVMIGMMGMVMVGMIEGGRGVNIYVDMFVGRNPIWGY
jgi:hypothetical protein